jgi:hypothetical protein
MIPLHGGAEHFLGFESDLDSILQAVVAQLFVEEPARGYPGVGGDAGKKGNGLRNAELAKDVFRLVLLVSTFEWALPKAEIGTGWEQERDGHALIVPANGLCLHGKAVFSLRGSASL